MKRSSLWPITALLSGSIIPFSAPAHQGEARAIEEIVVYGRADSQLGKLSAASAGYVAADDIRLPPLLRTGELVEAVPGMVATQHSGTGKANQYFLRGFNLDHGTDFAGYLHGMPLNMRSHGHGQGYLDLNFLIPELVAETHYRKGPYRADRGDFASAGSAEFRYYQKLPENLLSFAAGEDGYRRALVAGSARQGNGQWLVALDGTRGDGPWVLPEDLQQHKLHIGYGYTTDGIEARIALDGYHSRWQATDQVPQRAVNAGLISPLGFIDPDLGGATDRWSLNGSVRWSQWELQAFAVHYDFDLYSNFTYALEDPVSGDEFKQYDRRNLFGGSAHRDSTLQLWQTPVQLRVGIDLRHDQIDAVGLGQSVARELQSATRDDAVRQSSIGAFVETELELSQRLRFGSGVRVDTFDYRVTAQRAANSGTGRDTVVSPSVSIAYRIGEWAELFGNWGRGFHSNDVRGATISVDPANNEPTTPVDVFARSNGAELGLRLEGRRANLSLTSFWLELDSELVFVGDAGATEANGASRRYGIEASGFWQLSPWLALNLDYSRTRARFKERSNGGTQIPGAVASTLSLGLFGQWANGLQTSARLRYLGKAPLVEDGSIDSDAALVLNAGIAYRWQDVTVRLDLFNALDSDDNDIAYFYASRLPGEGRDGVEDLHSHPLQPRQLRGSINWHF